MAHSVARHEADAGIVIDGAGIGSAIAANKIPGIRAAMASSETMARYGREHNGANVLTLGATLVSAEEARAHRLRVAVDVHARSERYPAPREDPRSRAEREGLPVNMTPGELARLIDHTLLRPEATRQDIETLCREAVEHRFATVCVNPVWVALAAAMLKGSGVRRLRGGGISAGRDNRRRKGVRGARSDRGRRARDRHASSTSARSSRGDLDEVRRDIEAVTVSCREGGALSKVIIEAALLTDDEKVSACTLAKAAGADFVKTSTGFGPGGATVADVALMRVWSAARWE